MNYSAFTALYWMTNKEEKINKMKSKENAGVEMAKSCYEITEYETWIVIIFRHTIHIYIIWKCVVFYCRVS